jgi:hypothetical protein
MFLFRNEPAQYLELVELEENGKLSKLKKMKNELNHSSEDE